MTVLDKTKISYALVGNRSYELDESFPSNLKNYLKVENKPTAYGNEKIPEGYCDLEHVVYSVSMQSNNGKDVHLKFSEDPNEYLIRNVCNELKLYINGNVFAPHKWSWERFSYD